MDDVSSTFECPHPQCSQDICDGLDYLDSGLCVTDLKEGTAGWGDKNMKTWKDLHLFELSETPGPKKGTEWNMPFFFGLGFGIA